MPRPGSGASRVSHGQRRRRPSARKPAESHPGSHPVPFPNYVRVPSPEQLAIIRSSIAAITARLRCPGCANLLSGPAHLLTCDHALCSACVSRSVAFAQCVASECSQAVRPSHVKLACGIGSVSKAAAALDEYGKRLGDIVNGSACQQRTSPRITSQAQPPSASPSCPVMVRVRPPRKPSLHALVVPVRSPRSVPLRLRLRPSALLEISAEKNGTPTAAQCNQNGAPACDDPQQLSGDGNHCGDTGKNSAAKPSSATAASEAVNVAEVPAPSSTGEEEAGNINSTYAGLKRPTPADIVPFSKDKNDVIGTRSKGPVVLRLRIRNGQEEVVKEQSQTSKAQTDQRKSSDPDASDSQQRTLTGNVRKVEHGADRIGSDRRNWRNAQLRTHHAVNESRATTEHKETPSGSSDVENTPTGLGNASPGAGCDKVSPVLSVEQGVHVADGNEASDLVPQVRSAEQTTSAHDVRSRSGDTPCAICVTSLRNDLEVELADELIARLGGEFASGFRREPHPSVVVTSLNPMTSCIENRTMILHEALARRIPIVSLSWLVESFKAGTWLSARPFIAAPCLLQGEHPVFQGVLASFDSEFDNPSKPLVQQAGEDIRRIMQAGGATVTESGQKRRVTEELSNLGLRVHVACTFRDVEDSCAQVSAEEMAVTRSSKAQVPMKIVSMPWISDCLFSGRCPPPNLEKSESFSMYSASDCEHQLTPVG